MSDSHMFLTTEQCIQASQTNPEAINSHSATSIALLWSVIDKGSNPGLWEIDSKGRNVIPVELFNSIENTYQTENFSPSKATGLILRGMRDGEHLIGFTNKKIELLQAQGMGPGVHLEQVPYEESVIPDQLICPDFITSLVEMLRAHVLEQASHDNVFFDKRHLEQLADPSFPDYLIQTFRPIFDKLNGSQVTLKPHILTYGGGSPRTLITFSQLLEQLNQMNTQPYTQVTIPEMWGSNTLTHNSETGLHGSALVGCEYRGSQVIYYRGQYEDLLQ